MKKHFQLINNDYIKKRRRKAFLEIFHWLARLLARSLFVNFVKSVFVVQINLNMYGQPGPEKITDTNVRL